MPELLIELLSEEVPARMQARAAADFEKVLQDRLAEADLAHGGIDVWITPRRLALSVHDLAERQPDRKVERKGPRVGAPEQAVQGFLRSAGLSSLDQCEERTIGKAAFWFAVSTVEGQATTDVLPGLIADAIRFLPWPKSMRWADGEFRYVRPLQRINVVYDGKPLAGSLDLGGGLGKRAFGAETEGHRFMAPGPFRIENFAQYKRALREHYVILDQDERRETIAAGLSKAAEAEGLRVRPDPRLLDEVTGLVEWPVVHLGDIDAEFMDLPPEVLTTSMREHQKYFALESAADALAPRFAVVANRETADGGKAVVAGNERVLRARLSDAKFFWDQDRRQPLAARLPALNDVVFHARLGSLGERVQRLAVLSEWLAGYVPNADLAKARQAATLAKADLTSGMVGEFPELQGVMGRYYARHEGLDPDVAEAIAQHYAPQGPSDACPSQPVAIAVAVAEKIDTLAGFFAINERPTGSRDPFALRRAALGVIRLVLENGLRLPLREAFVRAHASYGERLNDQTAAAETAAALLSFFADRLKVHLREQGIRHDRVAAAFAQGQPDDLVRLMAQVRALSAFLATDDGANLLTAYRRAANIVQIEEKKDGRRVSGSADPALFADPAEGRLANALGKAAVSMEQALAAEDFDLAMSELAKLRNPVDTFFEQVTVNADDPTLRANRLRLLGAITETMGQVADFSAIEG